MLFQCVGALLAGIVLRIVFWVHGNEVLFGMPMYNVEELNWWRAGAAEVFFTFVVMFVVMACVVDSRRQGKQFFGLCYGMAQTACILAGGSISGASLNPARYLGPAVVAGPALGSMSQAGVYLVSPFIGAVLAALLYKSMFLQAQPAPEDEG
jgi:aquaporin Z